MEFSRNFVCATREKSTFQKPVASPVFRKSFTLSKKPARAEILICGLGFYDLYVNGKKITKGILAPYISNPDDIIYYDHYDVAPDLEAGENVIGVLCGNGHNNPMTFVWDFYTAPYASAPKLALSFEADCGGETVRFDATSFTCTESEILFDNLRAGAFVDARRIEKGRFEKGFDDSHWRKPFLAEQPRGIAKLCECEPVVIVGERKPVSVQPGELKKTLQNRRRDGFLEKWGKTAFAASDTTGGYMYDFGYNDSGILRLKIKGKPGQVISIQTAELMTDGKVDCSNVDSFMFDGYFQRDIYICSGEGEEIFEPPFCYHGYRYVYVTGIEPAQATDALLTYLVAHSDLESRGGFSCSDADANALYEMAARSDLSNFYYFPTDCPHREKNGWTGDASMSAEHMILTLGVEKSWREWLHNIRMAQTPAGMLPGIIPTTGHQGWGYAWGNGPVWDSVLFELPWCAYLYCGETVMIEENAAAMLRYLEYISRRRDQRGLIACGLGDWVPTDKKGADDYETPLALTDSTAVYDMCIKGEKMFTAVGLSLHAAFAKKLGEEVRASIRRHLIDLHTMVTDGATITGQAIVIYYNLLDAGEKQRAFDAMLAMLRARDKSWNFGMIGLRTVFHVLADFGEADLAYELITRRTYPSYGALLERGETTIVEVLRPDGEDCGSHNHHFLCDFKHWYLRQIVGICVNPGGDDANNVVIRPHFISKLTHAQGYHILKNGRVDVSWKRTGADTVELTLKCDKGVSAHLSLPPTCVIESGYYPPAAHGAFPPTQDGASFTVQIRII